MDSLISDLQRDALNEDMKVSGLLRKALVVAEKLGVEEFKSWINYELNGYPNSVKSPEYRIINVEVKYFNPFHGWKPILFEDFDMAKRLSKRECGQSVAEIEELLTNETDSKNVFAILLPKKDELIITKTFDLPSQPQLIHSKSELIKVVSSVRNIILEWAIKLEKDGICGRNLTFNQAELTSAKQTSYTVNHFHAPIESSQIQINSDNSSQSITEEGFDSEKLIASFDMIKKSISDLNLHQDKQKELLADIATILSQIESPKPKNTIIQESLVSLKNILEGSATPHATIILSSLFEKIF